jgi:hypothetical protein
VSPNNFNILYMLILTDTGHTAVKRSRIIQSTTPSSSSESIADTETTKPSIKDRGRDIDEFFDPPAKGPDGKPRRRCKVCVYVLFRTHFIFCLIAWL